MVKPFKNQVNASSFIHWYFSDSDLLESFSERSVEMISAEGFVNISARQLFEECSFIPQYICEVIDGDNEYSPQDVEYINDIN